MVIWTEAMGLYRAQDGAVRIEKPDSSGEFRLASFADRCNDANGVPVTVASLTSATHNQVVIEGGVGHWIPGTGLEIRWTGSFTVVFYGGMTYWSVSDPVLTVDANGTGRVTATASGYAASMEDLSKWEPIAPRSIVLAELRSVPVEQVQGFATEPLYVGVQVADAGQAARTSANADYWGAFPESFVQFQKLTGQSGYWLTTGGQRDRAKVPTTLYISYDTSVPISPLPPADDSEESTAIPTNPVRNRPAGSAAGSPAAQLADVFSVAGSRTVTPQGPGLLSGIVVGVLGNRNLLLLLWRLLAVNLSAVSILSLKSRLLWQRPRSHAG